MLNSPYQPTSPPLITPKSHYNSPRKYLPCPHSYPTNSSRFNNSHHISRINHSHAMANKSTSTHHSHIPILFPRSSHSRYSNNVLCSNRTELWTI